MPRSVQARGAAVAITGAARGIGLATAEAFLDAGVRVAIGDRDVDLAGQVAEHLAAQHGTRVVALPLDVTDKASFGAFLDATTQAFGRLDVLVNNAGIMPTGPLLDEDDGITDRVIDVNLRAVITGCKLAGARFARQGSGHIINVSSLLGTYAAPGVATYCASKYALIGFSDAFRLEIADAGVGVTTVLPGVVRTELATGTQYPAWADRFIAVEPGDVARAIVAAVGSTRGTVAVPAPLYAVSRLSAVLPLRLRSWLERRPVVADGFVSFDPQVRAAYHQRIAED